MDTQELIKISANINKFASGIYLIIDNLGDRIYVGQAKRINERFNTHLCELRANKHGNDYLQNIFNKYEESNLSFLPIENCSLELLNEREGFWSLQFPKEKLLNLAKIGQYFPVTEATREKMRIKATGRKHSEETKKKIGLLGKGRPSPNKGKKASPETIAKMSLAFKGKAPQVTEEQRIKGKKLRRIFVDNKKTGVNAEIAREIKLLLPLFPNCVIAEKLGVSATAVSNIRVGTSWKHIIVELPEELKNLKPKKRSSYGMKGKTPSVESIAKGQKTKSERTYKPAIRTEEQKEANSQRLKNHYMNNPKKLTVEQVKEIKKLLKEGLKQNVIAPLFGVTKSTIGGIKRGINWKDVTID